MNVINMSETFKSHGSLCYLWLLTLPPASLPALNQSFPCFLPHYNGSSTSRQKLPLSTEPPGSHPFCFLWGHTLSLSTVSSTSSFLVTTLNMKVCSHLFYLMEEFPFKPKPPASTLLFYFPSVHSHISWNSLFWLPILSPLINSSTHKISVSTTSLKLLLLCLSLYH